MKIEHLFEILASQFESLGDFTSYAELSRAVSECFTSMPSQLDSNSASPRPYHVRFVNELSWQGETKAPLRKIGIWTHFRKIKRKPLMRDFDWLKLNLRLIFLISVQTQILCYGA